MTILLVEEEWLVCSALADDLRHGGCPVAEAESGEAAVAMLRDGFEPAVLVTDIQLAGALTGWDVAGARRSRDPDIRVVYTSGAPPVGPRRVADSVFIGKPCDLRNVLRACRGHLDPKAAPSRELRPSA